METKELLEQVGKEGIALVDFYGTWCSPCKMLAPVLDELSEGYKVIKIDVDKEHELASEYGVMTVPMVLIYKDGVLKDSFRGYQSVDFILEKIENLC